MDNNQQKWVNLSFVAASLLLAYVIFVLAMKFSVVLDLDGRVQSLDRVLMGVSVLIGALMFVGLYKSRVASGFMNEVVAEVSKVTWPTNNETFKGTIAVLIAVTIAGIVLWTVDSVWVFFISKLI